MPTEKTQTKQTTKQTNQKQTPNNHKPQNKKGRVISWSVRNVGNLKNGDSIVSSMISS
jgi:hypothetical protein